MATNQEYLYYLLDSLSSLDGISHRMMMGEYILYYHGKIAAYVCDDRLLVKLTPTALAMLPNAELDSICEGGRKKLLRVDAVDDRDFLTALFTAIEPELPEPKKKASKTKTKKPNGVSYES